MNNKTMSEKREPEFENPNDTPEYQSFVSEMAKYCKCEFDQPCDGVLAGGICERRTHRDSDSYEWSETEKYDE